LINLLPSDRLKDLFDAAMVKAKAHWHQLLLCHPFDLLQIKTSYLHDGHDVPLILHILMGQSDSHLWLVQLCPIPLPFTDTHMLMPDPVNQILAISSSSERLSIGMSLSTCLAVIASIRSTCGNKMGCSSESLMLCAWGCYTCRISKAPWPCTKWRSFQRSKLSSNFRTTGTWCTRHNLWPARSPAWNPASLKSLSSMVPT
jgi:hypothetical protein